MFDFKVTNHGSVWIVTPETNEGVMWVDENVSEERTNFCGGFSVEPRYIPDLIDGIEQAGLSIH